MAYDEAFNLIRDLEGRAIECETDAEADFCIELAFAIGRFYEIEGI